MFTREHHGRYRLVVKWGAVLIAGSAAIALGYGALFVLGSGSADSYVAEDQVVETVGALGFFATSLFLLLMFIVGRRTGQFGAVKQILLIGLVLLFLFGAGEEISWGQRYLGLGTPTSWESRNVQGELNLHNVEHLSGWLDSDYLFRAFWVLFGVVVPVAAAVSVRTRAKLDRWIPVFPLWVAVFLVLNQIIAEAASALNNYQPTWYEGSYYTFAGARFEVTESVISVIFGIGAYALYRRTKKAAATGVGDQPKSATTGTEETESGT